jgi:1-acyl-sn-glycerol-3-phosphate acyltransferase
VFRKKKIDEWAFDYWLLQRYAKLAFRIYYKKIQITGRENIPLNSPVILAPNHQNALMDAMVLVCNTEFQLVFLARADIFKGRLMTRFLNYLNIMPIYRLRDGIENVKRNDEVFQKTVDVLRNKYNPLILFPEGNHGDKRRLRPLVKGLFRIAFMAQEDYGNNPAVKIVPVGIDYSHYQNFRSTLFINIGKPVEVSEYFGTYSENPVAGINRIKEDYAGVLADLIINIKSAEYYDLYMNLRGIANDLVRERAGIRGSSLADKFRADKILIAALDKELESNPGTVADLDALVKSYNEGLNKYNFRDWVLKKRRPGFPAILLRALAFIISFPVFLFGFAHNIIPYAFTATRVKGIRDPQFHSSFKYVIGMISFPLMYVIAGVALAFTGWPLIIKILYILLMPLAGLFAFYYYIQFKKFRSLHKYYMLAGKKDGSFNELQKLRERILATVDKITISL